MRAEIITIGDELLIGQVVDTNSAWMAEQLNEHGIELYQITSVHDDRTHIVNALNEAFSRVDIVLTTGGLGPTKDDITKHVLCEYFGSHLIEDTRVRAHVESLYQDRPDVLNRLTATQWMVPECAEILPNRVGSAPLMVFHKEDKLLACMPGVPYEMKIAMTEQILPYIQRTMYKGQRTILHRTLQVTGIAESSLAILLEDFENAMPSGLHLAYLPKDGIIRLRLSSYGELGQEQMECCFDELKRLAADYLIADTDEPLELILGRRLTANGQTIATAESCTGGKLASLLSKHPGSSAFYYGSVVSYDNSVKEHVLGVPNDIIKTHGVVSKEVVCEMANNVRNLLGTDYSIATSGIAGPSGGSEQKPVGTVWIAWATPQGTTAECFHLGKLREQVTDRACMKALMGMLQRTKSLMMVLLMLVGLCSFEVPDTIVPQLLPASVNTVEGEEYGPTISMDDNMLFFVGLNRYGGNETEDIFVSYRDKNTGEWGPARRIQALSNPYRNEAPTSISGDGRTMLVFVEGRMCFSMRDARGWSEPRPLPQYLQIGNWQADAMITADGSALLYAANYPAEGEEKASLNIFVSTRQADGRWSQPFSIGPAINTRGMERSPFLHPDMKTLYFSSNRPGTYGDLDVWVSRRLSDTCWTCWSEPENLGPQINTRGRDCWYKISTDGKTAYYAQKTGSRHDIYRITLPQEVRPEQITVLKTNEPVAITNLLFETASDVIMDSSLPELKRIATFIQTYGYKVRLAGHTDNVGQSATNQSLSQARAESVRRQLIAYGCAEEAIQAFGYGDTKPVATNDTEEGRQQNRRVEITLIP